ncbi:hypothetical protein S83_058501 [Arachis hypogaea]
MFVLLFQLTNITTFTLILYSVLVAHVSSRNKGKGPATAAQRNQQHHRLHFLKPSLPITPNDLPNRTPYLNLVVPDGRDVRFRCFWKEQQNGSIALTRGLPQFYRSGRENNYQPRPSEELPYEKQSTYQRAHCMNNPSSNKAKAIVEKFSTKCPFSVMDLTSPSCPPTYWSDAATKREAHESCYPSLINQTCIVWIMLVFNFLRILLPKVLIPAKIIHYVF